MSIKSFLGSTLNLCESGDTSSQSQQTEQEISGWQPSYLRRRVLIVFEIIFCGVIAALEALNYVPHIDDGISASIKGRHYLGLADPLPSSLLSRPFGREWNFKSSKEHHGSRWRRSPWRPGNPCSWTMYPRYSWHQ
ncbi:hypothetical protein PEX1_041900 [Penicillium expansum]|uniref:Uncharacterized protein n=1 Tax=Penicillium expansum TaxID=27334 RepID=A0A0A2JL90_PENEN|nr:hypothetical protein PEX2_050840 [Penicillium expansum]KGO44303.1 hypothetical protein PEXP_056510 [Penicillium expansum]KGO55596.1 hypothetical protein PEX2_050840 [Penicillium expansum]KGO70116.1 hypothetical protein PEX1_041900 [Penicillium expansum]